MSSGIEKIKTDIAELRQEFEQLKLAMSRSFERLIVAIEKIEETHK